MLVSPFSVQGRQIGELLLLNPASRVLCHACLRAQAAGVGFFPKVLVCLPERPAQAAWEWGCGLWAGARCCVRSSRGLPSDCGS